MRDGKNITKQNMRRRLYFIRNAEAPGGRQALFRAAIATTAAAVLLWGTLLGVPLTQRITAEQIAHEQGFAYHATLPPWRASWPLAVKFDSSDTPEESTARILENGRPLGLPHNIHDQIRKAGNGRYSHWGSDQTFYLSTSDNSDPRTNGREYAVRVFAQFPQWSLFIAALLIAYSVFIAGPVVVGALTWLTKSAQRVSRRYAAIARLINTSGSAVRSSWNAVSAFGRLVLPSIAGIVVVFLLVLAIGETYFRLTVPFAEATWPTRYIDGVGWLLKPNTVVRHTNHLDFWVEEKTNSFGFLDREPLSSGITQGCRVALVGDSFVEAAQVKNEEKVQALLEHLSAARQPPLSISAAGYGFSGTGQLNQLPFYEHYAKATSPDVVVLVFVANDLSNNSSVLESVQHGFHPLHAPRTFAKKDRTSGAVEIQAPDPDWEKHLVQLAGGVADPTCWLCEQHKRLVSLSLFYRWVTIKLRLLAPGVLAIVEPPTSSSLGKARVQWLSSLPQFVGQFGSWQGTTGVEEMFFQSTLPPVFEDALEFTGFAFAEFKRRVENDGGKLIILSASHVRSPLPGRDTYFNRMRALADKLDIPVLDQYEWLQHRNESAESVHFRHDSHWNQHGHQVVAEMILDYIASHPSVCSRRFGSYVPDDPLPAVA